MIQHSNDSIPKDRARKIPYCITFLIGCLLILYVPTTFAQQEEKTRAKTLEEILITAKREAIVSGNSLQEYDSTTLASYTDGNLFDLLSRTSFAYIRTYGPSGLSTPTFRGTGGSQTAILWNGINLQSPMNGSADFTLLPMAFVNELSVQYGGEGALFSSGSMGGAVHMHTSEPQKVGFGAELQGTIGDFGQRYTALKLNWKNRKFSSRITGLWNEADNNFKFVNNFKAQKPIEERRHAGIEQKGMLWENFLDLNPKTKLSLRLWHQDNQVEIPAVSSSSQASRAGQKDRFTRAILEVKRHGRWRQEWKTALLQHSLNYQDPAIGVTSDSRSWQYIHQWEAKTLLGKRAVLHTGLHHHFERAEVQNYGSNLAERHRWDLFSSVQWASKNNNLEVNLNWRQAINSGLWSPFLPGLNAKYRLHRSLHLRGSISKTYRIPTFNDLFWQGVGAVGNPDLQEEKGSSADIGIENSKPLNLTKNLSINSSFTLFSNRSRNWITWQSNDDGIWSPLNKEKVHAKGIEASTKIMWQLGQWSLRTRVAYTLTEALIVSSNNPNELNKTLTYTPKHLGRASLQLKGHGFTLHYNHIINGRQFIDFTDSFNTLPRFQVGDVSLSKSLSYKRYRFALSFRVDNLWNHSYEVRKGWPMPLRNKNISLKIQF